MTIAPKPITELINLTDAVEAAAKAWFNRQQEGRRDAGRFRDDGKTLLQWEDIRDIDRVGYRELVLPIVTAAAPSIARQGWAVGVDQGVREADSTYASPCPFREVSS